MYSFFLIVMTLRLIRNLQVLNSLPDSFSPLLKIDESRKILPKESRSNRSDYPNRFVVPDEFVDWNVAFKEYAPKEFTHPNVLKVSINPDPIDVKNVDFSVGGLYRIGFEPNLHFPFNPRGRTGLMGRGRLYRWGPNIAVDAIVTRMGKDKELEIVAIKRSDNGKIAFPGGFLDAGENVIDALKREFKEEVGNLQDPTRFDQIVNALFTEERGIIVYAGYIDDSRNTDQSWIESIAVHFACLESEFDLPLAHGDDAAACQWLRASDVDANFFSGHQSFLKKILEHK